MPVTVSLLTGMTPPTVMEEIDCEDVPSVHEFTDLTNWISFLAKKEDTSPEEYVRFLFSVACVEHEDLWIKSPLFSHHLKMGLDSAFEGVATDFFLIEVVKASHSYSKLTKQDGKYVAKISKLIPASTPGHHQYWVSGKKNKSKKAHNCYCIVKQCINVDTCVMKRFPHFACTLDYWVIDENNMHNLDNCKMLCHYCYANLFTRPIDKIKEDYSSTLTVSEASKWQMVNIFTAMNQIPSCCNPECSFAPDYREYIPYHVQPFSQTLRSHMLCPTCYTVAHENEKLSEFDLLQNDCESCGNSTVKARLSFRKICDDLLKL